MGIVAYTKQIKEWVARYEHYLMPLALLFGFVIDNLTLTRIDQWFDNVVLASYLLLAALGIVLYHLINTGRVGGLIANRLVGLLPLLVQFAFGGLFSGFLVFYSRGASIFSSWLFVLILAGLLVGNEILREQYRRFQVQMGILFVALFSFLVFFVPVVVKAIGPYVFLLSSAVSIAVMALFLYLLSFVLQEKVTDGRRVLALSVVTITLIFNGLYFMGAIPPLPLSLKDAGVYHTIEKTNSGTYAALGEPVPWYLPFRSYNKVYERAPGESVYVYSAVFAPTDLTETIGHRWEYYDEARGAWTNVGTVRFSITGGRAEGYRGYSTKYGPAPGKWRVTVVTEGGLPIGRISFRVETVDEQPNLTEEIL